MSEGIEREERRESVKALLGRISSILGLLLGAAGILFALFGASANISAGELKASPKGEAC